MIRSQLQLTAEQNERLRELSKTTREPIAVLIRKAVDQFLLIRRPDRFYLYRQAESVIGKYEAGLKDVSINHDKFLKEAFDA